MIAIWHLKWARQTHTLTTFAIYSPKYNFNRPHGNINTLVKVTYCGFALMQSVIFQRYFKASARLSS